MTIRSRPRPALTFAALAVGLSLLGGCTGPNDDKQGSGYASGTGAPGPEGNGGLSGQGKPTNADTGSPDNPSNNRPEAGVGDRTKTGGLGTGGHVPPGEGGTRSAAPDATGAK